MAKNSIADWDTTAANNTDVGGINLAEGTATVDDMNDAFREIMAQVKTGAATQTGTETLTNKTLTAPTITGATLTTTTVTTPTLTLKQSTAPTPTAEGDIQWDTDDNAIVVGDGAAAKTFRANAWETIVNTVVASVSAVDTSNLSAYKTLRVSGRFNPSADGVGFSLITSADNGSTFATTSGDYTYTQIRVVGTTASGNGAAVATEIGINATSVGNAAGEGVAFDFLINDFNAATHTLLTGTCSGVNVAGDAFAASLMGKRNSSQVLNAFRIFVTSGTFSGPFIVEGIRG